MCDCERIKELYNLFALITSGVMFFPGYFAILFHVNCYFVCVNPKMSRIWCVFRDIALRRK